jgi:hypothetical protein
MKLRKFRGIGREHVPLSCSHVNMVDVLSMNEYRIFKPIEITIRRGLR